MSTLLLNQGKFSAIGDYYVLQLLPISNIVNFVSFSDIIYGEVGVVKVFTKEFRYRINGGSFSPWTALTNPNLAAIVIASQSDVYEMEIKYTRSGTDPEGYLTWTEFSLDSVKVDPCLIIRINKTNYDTKYLPAINMWDKIDNALVRFNDYSLEEFGKYVYLVDDNTVSGVEIILDRITGCTTDVNELLKTAFGKNLIKTFFDIGIDVFDGIPS